MQKISISLLLCLLLTACATSVPRDYERIDSRAYEYPENTLLGRFFGPELAAHPGKSGIILVPTGEWGFRSRAGLANAAEQTLDVQYYIWEADTAGKVLVERLLRAADRGVRVRMLLDHFTVRDVDFKFAQVDQHPNIEIRLFNPYANRTFRNFEFLTSFSQLNHRMHNKAFIADNAMAVVGGRNIGDNYFGVDSAANFRDLDMAMAGPVVQEVSRSFDEYWNSDLVVPVSAIIEEKLSAEELKERKEALYRWVGDMQDFPYPIDTTCNVVLDRMKALRSEFIWAYAQALYDDPDKLASKEEAVADRLLQLGSDKQHEVAIEAAYVIPGPAGVERTRLNNERGFRQRLFTNSLATNDVAAAHAGYAKYRRDLIRNGMELYELRPDAGSVKKNWSLLAGRSRASLHTKAFVVDRGIVVIGSFNVDPRSITINTEIVIMVESTELAARVLAYMDAGVLPENSYRVILEPGGAWTGEQLVWITEKDGKEVRYYSEPETGVWQRFTAWFMGLLPIEDQL